MVEFAVNHNIWSIFTFFETVLRSKSDFPISRCFVKIHGKLFFHRFQDFHRSVLRTSRSRTTHYLVFNLGFFDRWNEFYNRLDVFLINFKSLCDLFLVTNRHTPEKSWQFLIDTFAPSWLPLPKLSTVSSSFSLKISSSFFFTHIITLLFLS